MVLVLAFRVVVVHSRVVITFGRKKIFSRVIPYAKHSQKYLDDALILFRKGLLKIGVPASAIKTKIIHAGSAIEMNSYGVSVKVTSSVVKAVAKQSGKTIRSMSDAKKAIIASIATSLAVAEARIKPKKSKKPAKKPTKHVLTTKQKAALKKNGYVYIVRSGNKIKIKR